MVMPNFDSAYWAGTWVVLMICAIVLLVSVVGLLANRDYGDDTELPARWALVAVGSAVLSPLWPFLVVVWVVGGSILLVRFAFPDFHPLARTTQEGDDD